MNNRFTKSNKPVRPRKRVGIFSIVVGILIAIFLGILIYQYVTSMSSGSISEARALEIISKIEKKETYQTNNNYRYDSLKKITLYNQNRFAASTGTVQIEYTISSIDGKRQWNTRQSVYVNNIEKFRENITDPATKQKIFTVNSYPITVFSVFTRIGSQLLFLLPLIWIFYFFFYRMQSGLNIDDKYATAKLSKSDVMFSDVAGIKEEKNELLEIVEFLKHPNRYLDVGARIPKGLLLYGPPGTGKTLLAKAVSGESGVPFFSAAGSSFEGMFVGLGASRIRDLFAKAKKNAPCIIFIDEIDSLGSKRQNTFSSVQSQSLNQFLSELDGFETTAGVIVIAATNRIEVLDSALLRSGRFDRKIQINLPDVKERAEILRIHSRNKKIGKQVDFGEIAARTPGFSGAELENSLNEAALQAVRKNHTVIEAEDIDEGIDRVIGGPAKTSRVINQKTRTIVALHESGHALIGLLLADASKVQKVTIIPRGSAGGYTITTPKDETTMYSKETLTHQVIGLLGGRGAEETILGHRHITTGAYDDFTKATHIVERMIKEFGMSALGVRFTNTQNNLMIGINSPLSETKKTAIDKEIDRFLTDCLNKAKQLIAKNKNLLFLIAESLLILETINASQIEYIHKNKALPEEALEQKRQNPAKKFLDLDLFKEEKNPSSEPTKNELR